MGSHTRLRGPRFSNSPYTDQDDFWTMKAYQKPSRRTLAGPGLYRGVVKGTHNEPIQSQIQGFGLSLGFGIVTGA